jgi:oligopeptide/dipeptide ABC transporter ATP-binding protein
MTASMELDNVTKIYSSGMFHRKATTALENVYLSVGGDRPSMLAIAGESGSGKTTLGMLLLGFLAPTRGEVRYKGKNVWRMSKEEHREFRREVQAVFQDPFEVYNPFYKVDHLLHAVIKMFKLARSRQEERALMEQSLESVGLRPEETLGRYPHELSGGQRQRITIARALLLKPKLIMADEPVSMVDASLRATILESLRKLNQDMGTSILYITHDLATAYHISDDIMVFYQGSVTEAGNTAQIIQEPLHPYTRLLVGAIPWPDPKRRWVRAATGGSGERTGDKGKGCKFAPRCARSMSICYESFPDLFRTEDNRAVACYLYRDYPALRGSEIGQVMSSGVGASPQGTTQP